VGAERHQSDTLYIGDTWKIYGTLYNDDGTRMNLTGNLDKVQWALTNGTTSVVHAAQVTIEDVDADQGDFRIVVPDTVTIGVPAGRYTGRAALCRRRRSAHQVDR
jgi:hypothetical protein